MEKYFPIKIAAPATAVVAGIILAVYEVQGWNMPSWLAILLLVILFGLLAVFIIAIFIQGIKSGREFLERRSTSADWVAKEPPGIFDCEVDGKRALDQLTEELKKLSSDTGRLSIKIIRHNKKLQELQNPQKKPIKPENKQKIANKVGNQINRSATYIEKRTQLFNTLVSETIRNYDVLTTNLKITNEEERNGAKILGKAFQSFDSAADNAIDGLTAYKQGVTSLITLNLTRNIRSGCNRLMVNLDNMIGNFYELKSNFKRFGEVIEKNIADY